MFTLVCTPLGYFFPQHFLTGDFSPLLPRCFVCTLLCTPLDDVMFSSHLRSPEYYKWELGPEFQKQLSSWKVAHFLRCLCGLLAWLASCWVSSFFLFFYYFFFFNIFFNSLCVSEFAACAGCWRGLLPVGYLHFFDV